MEAGRRLVKKMAKTWRDIPGYEDLYQVSDSGDIKALNYKNTHTEQIMRPGYDKDGYRYVGLTKDKKKRYFKVHRLVYEAFTGSIPDGYEINHLNEDKGDNRVENLEAVCHKQNINHGTCSQRAGEKHHKPVYQYSGDDRFIQEWSSMSEAAEILNIDISQISGCCKNKKSYYTAGGYKWSYKKKEV